MRNISLILIVILIILLFVSIDIGKHENFTTIEKEKPFLWQYWDTPDGKKIPAYIELCFETVNKNCSDSFNIIRLNKSNISNYIPEIKKYKPKLDKLIIAHKVDIYRIFLLHKFGGLYMDADVICLRDPIEVIHKLEEYDFVGFGCTGEKCKFGYGFPSNWIMASKKNGILMTRSLSAIKEKIGLDERINYHDLGKVILWNEIKKIQNEQNYTYFHYPNRYDGSRDIDGKWINSDIVFSNQKIKYDDNEDMLFFVFYNSDTKNYIKNMSKCELLNKNWNYSKYMKKALA